MQAKTARCEECGKMFYAKGCWQRLMDHLVIDHGMVEFVNADLGFMDRTREDGTEEEK